MKETWKTINQLVNKRSKTTNISSLQEENKVLTGCEEIAESMNQYYCSIGQNLSSKIIDACRKSTFVWRFFLEQIF